MHSALCIHLAFNRSFSHQFIQLLSEHNIYILASNISQQWVSVRTTHSGENVPFLLSAGAVGWFHLVPPSWETADSNHLRNLHSFPGDVILLWIEQKLLCILFSEHPSCALYALQFCCLPAGKGNSLGLWCSVNKLIPISLIQSNLQHGLNLQT